MDIIYRVNKICVCTIDNVENVFHEAFNTNFYIIIMFAHEQAGYSLR